MDFFTISQKQYPDLLRNIPNPPQKLFYQGQLTALSKPCFSIVGTRKHSEYGEFITRKLVNELAILDITIVSGLAIGIDTLAHQAALDNNLPTIAILGSGLQKIFPRENQTLSQKITKTGLLLSEYEAHIPPLKYHFPQRNRIVSGLSLATIVIEAPEKSGALITAYLANDQGREIFVVPGDIHRPNSQGIIKLLQKACAHPISSGQDIINYLQEQHSFFPNEKATKSPPLPKYKLSPEESKVLNTLSPYRGLYLDEIQKKTLLPTSTTLAILSLLEIQGLIKTKHGKYCRLN